MLFVLLTIVSALIGLIAFAMAFKMWSEGILNGKGVVFLLIGGVSYFIVGINIGLLLKLKNLM